MEPVINGIYVHYKGNKYKVLNVAEHTETGEDFVIYEALYGEHKIWARPKDMFISKVTSNNVEMDRFHFTGEVG